MVNVWTPPTNIPRTPTALPSTSTGGGGGGGSSSGGGSSGGGSSSGGGGGGGGGSDPNAYAKKVRAEQKAEQKKAERKAARKFSKQARLLERQAAALRIALGKQGFKKALDTELKNIRLEYDDQNEIILDQYEAGAENLERQAQTTSQVLGETTGFNLSNAGRERNEALRASISNGIGALDLIRAQSASLRNWRANQVQAEQSAVVEQNSLISEAAQLRNTVIAQRSSAWQDREDAIGSAKRSFFDNRGEVLTQIGNKFGEASSYWEMAQEQKATKARRKSAKRTDKAMKRNLDAAARQTGRAYQNRGIPDSIKNWKGTANVETINRDERQWGQPQGMEVGRAEGATLRRWEK